MIYLIYAALAGLATIVSGLLPLHSRVSGIERRYVVALASGVVIATALFEMIPESDSESNWLFIGIGFFSFYLAERIMMIHSHGGNEVEVGKLGWVSIAGISSDNFIDGVAIAVGYVTEPALGLIIALAVIMHEIPQGLTTTVVMRESGYSFRKIITVLIVAALLYPAGAVVSSIFPSTLYSPTVAFVAGEFLYVGAGELLPEAHKRFNLKVIATVLLGAVLVLIIELLA